MNRDDIMRLARESGFQTGWINDASGNPSWPIVQCVGAGCINELERFADLVIAAEREACARKDAE